MEKGDGVMFIVSKRDEIAVRVRDEETDVTALMAVAEYPDIEVLALRSYCDQEGVVLLLVTNNTSKTSRILEEVGYQCSTNPIVLVGPLNGRGWAAQLGSELGASGICVHYSYSHRTERGQYYLAFRTEEDDRAVRTLETTVTFRDIARAGSEPERYAIANHEAGLHQTAT
jgi:hypothetical protein